MEELEMLLLELEEKMEKSIASFERELSTVRTIEVGHIFKQNTHYTELLGCNYFLSPQVSVEGVISQMF